MLPLSGVTHGLAPYDPPGRSRREPAAPPASLRRLLGPVCRVRRQRWRHRRRGVRYAGAIVDRGQIDVGAVCSAGSPDTQIAIGGVAAGNSGLQLRQRHAPSLQCRCDRGAGTPCAAARAFKAVSVVIGQTSHMVVPGLQELPLAIERVMVALLARGGLASSVLLPAKPISLSHRTAPAGRSTNTTAAVAIPANDPRPPRCGGATQPGQSRTPRPGSPPHSRRLTQGATNAMPFAVDVIRHQVDVAVDVGPTAGHRPEQQHPPRSRGGQTVRSPLGFTRGWRLHHRGGHDPQPTTRQSAQQRPWP